MHIMYDVVNICKSVRTDAGGPGVFAYPTVYAHRCSCGLEGSFVAVFDANSLLKSENLHNGRWLALSA